MSDLSDIRPFEDDEVFDLNGRLDLGKLRPFTPAVLPESIFGRRAVRVLVVTDTEIAITPGGGFGVGRLIQLLRSATVGCTRFRVDVAVRSSGGFVDNGTVAEGQARYTGFRFDAQAGGQAVLDRYDTLMLFGFKPGNDAGPDSNINLPTSLPASNAELDRLMTWMDAGGGVFATGDHDYLGASMCSRIPRVGTMRQWTNAQGVPPIGGPTRLDTNQPATIFQRAGLAVIPNGVEGDAKPQPIEWVPDQVWYEGFIKRSRPHELLCHPKHGPIDVMPDHPHEGRCIRPSAIDGARTVNFGNGARPEYPGGVKPEIIAYGRVTPDPPLQHAKGDVNAERFPMISAYDGRSVGVGRVVVDSTWHHWFNMNIVDLEAENGEEWAKIHRYFVNVAKWLARPGRYIGLCWYEVLASHFSYPGIEEFQVVGNLANGAALQQSLTFFHGPCTVSKLVLGSICRIHPLLCKLIEVRTIPEIDPGPLRSFPSIELIEQVVLTGFVDGTRKLADEVKARIEVGKVDDLAIEAETIETFALEGAREALARFAKDGLAELDEVRNVFRSMVEEPQPVG